MEYVRGNPITDYCDRHRLTPRERLELFVLLCEGVQHAHQKAIIHRDLKPSNVLVVEQDGRLLPKVIDFGVAKATAQRLTEKTMFTELGVLIGTPEYMSPEQAGLTGEDVDTRTDVYSLGVILYEMLVGALPFDPKELRSGGFEGIRRMIREDEPKRPSTRFATLGERSGESARRRRTDPSSLLRLLRGDLDWIAHFTTDPVVAGAANALVYTLTVTNPGPSVVPASQAVTVVDTLPLETSGWMAAGTDWSPKARSCTYTLPRHPSSTARVARLPLTRSEHMADSERTASGCRWRSRGGRSPT
jgi:uncharacterized repeat protein (TIGR01451 family)